MSLKHSGIFPTPSVWSGSSPSIYQPPIPWRPTASLGKLRVSLPLPPAIQENIPEESASSLLEPTESEPPLADPASPSDPDSSDLDTDECTCPRLLPPIPDDRSLCGLTAAGEGRCWSEAAGMCALP
jgi:hypothetical protein